MRLISLIFLFFISFNSMAGYHLHIEREASISLEEWQKVVNEHEFVRITNKDVVGINPITKEEIRIVMPEGSAEVYFPESKEWITVFGFGRTIYFNATNAWEQKNSYIRTIVFQLANALSAKVIGDEGEEYFEK